MIVFPTKSYLLLPTAIIPHDDCTEIVFDAVMSVIRDADIFISTAAVSDFRPEESPTDRKLGKAEMPLTLKLARNKDILAAVAALEKAPMTVGFAAQTHDLEAAARQKLVAKKIDMIAANRVAAARGGFNSDENSLLVIWADGELTLPMMPKSQLAREFVVLVVERYTHIRQLLASDSM